MEMMLILPWLLGSGVTTAAIGDEEAEVSNDQMVQDLSTDGASDLGVTGDLIQDYVSSETVLAYEDSGETVAQWQDVVIGFDGDDELAGGVAADVLDESFDAIADDIETFVSELDDVELDAADFAIDLAPAKDLWAQIDALTSKGTSQLVETVADELDTLFAETFEEIVSAPVSDVAGVMQSNAFAGATTAEPVEQTVTQFVAPLLSETVETAAETLAEAEVVVEDNVGIAQAGENVVANADDVDEAVDTVEDTPVYAELSETLEVLYDTFDANPFAEAQATAQAAADILSDSTTDLGASLEAQVASAIASGDTETLEVIRNFVAGEDAIMVEYTGDTEPVVSVENDGDGNARIVVDGRQVAVVAAAAAMVTSQDIQAVRVDGGADQRA